MPNLQRVQTDINLDSVNRVHLRKVGTEMFGLYSAGQILGFLKTFKGQVRFILSHMVKDLSMVDTITI